jgi:hypothetical protein
MERSNERTYALGYTITSLFFLFLFFFFFSFISVGCSQKREREPFRVEKREVGWLVWRGERLDTGQGRLGFVYDGI